MAEPIEFNFETQFERISRLREQAKHHEADLDKLEGEIGYSDLLLDVMIEAAKRRSAGHQVAFRDISARALALRKESYAIVKDTRAKLNDDLKGREFNVLGQVYARKDTTTQSDAILDVVEIEAPCVAPAMVLAVEVPMGGDLRGYFSNFSFYTRRQHEGVTGQDGRTIDLPENPIHDRLYHSNSGDDFMFELNPYLILDMDINARLATGIAPLDSDRPDTLPILAHLSRVTLTPV